MKTQLLFFLFSIGFLVSCKEEVEDTPDIVTGLVVNIPLDGSAFDLASGTTGVIYKATAVSDRKGEIDKAMQFAAGDSAYIDFGDLEGASFPGNILTIACWVLVFDTIESRAVLSKREVGGPFEYSLDNHFSDNVFNLDNWVASGAGTVYGVDPLSASSPVMTGTWWHIAFVADGNTLKAYSDGVLQSGNDVRNMLFSFSNTGAPLIIGRGGAFGVNHYFHGCIDEIRIYNRALDDAAISALAKL